MPTVEFCTHPIFLYEYGYGIAPRLWYIHLLPHSSHSPHPSPRQFLSDSSISPLQPAMAGTGVTKTATAEVTGHTYKCSTALPQVTATLMYSAMVVSATPSFAAHTETKNHRSSMIDVINKGLCWYAIVLEFVRVRSSTDPGEFTIPDKVFSRALSFDLFQHFMCLDLMRSFRANHGQWLESVIDWPRRRISVNLCHAI
jgi:hypothetical protein